MIHRAPLVLKFLDWPDVDRSAWANLFQSQVRFGRARPNVDWSEGTKRLRCQSYGQWLSFLQRIRSNELALLPGDRISQDNVGAFLDECEERLKPRSTYNHLLTLALLARHWSPDADWTWLWAAVSKSRHAIGNWTIKPPPRVSADQVYQSGLRGLSEASEALDLFTAAGAVRFRQQLAMTLLIACPVRVRALAAMTVNRHVVNNGNHFILDFQAQDMKDGRDRRHPLPVSLTEPINLYLEALRPILKGPRETCAFWISRNGRPMTPDDLTKELYRTTGRSLNAPMHAHAFRHVVATSIAGVAPDKANAIRDVLGHATIEMSTKHYNRAEGSRRYGELQTVVAKLRLLATAKQRITDHDRDSASINPNKED